MADSPARTGQGACMRSQGFRLPGLARNETGACGGPGSATPGRQPAHGGRVWCQRPREATGLPGAAVGRGAAEGGRLVGLRGVDGRGTAPARAAMPSGRRRVGRPRPNPCGSPRRRRSGACAVVRATWPACSRRGTGSCPHQLSDTVSGGSGGRHVAPGPCVAGGLSAPRRLRRSPRGYFPTDEGADVGFPGEVRGSRAAKGPCGAHGSTGKGMTGC